MRVKEGILGLTCQAKGGIRIGSKFFDVGRGLCGSEALIGIVLACSLALTPTVIACTVALTPPVIMGTVALTPTVITCTVAITPTLLTCTAGPTPSPPPGTKAEAPWVRTGCRPRSVPYHERKERIT